MPIFPGTGNVLKAQCCFLNERGADGHSKSTDWHGNIGTLCHHHRMDSGVKPPLTDDRASFPTLLSAFPSLRVFGRSFAARTGPSREELPIGAIPPGELPDDIEIDLLWPILFPASIDLSRGRISLIEPFLAVLTHDYASPSGGHSLTPITSCPPSDAAQDETEFEMHRIHFRFTRWPKSFS
jgi:hypothetical protein